MPSIPKFAKEMVKRAKAKPKVISSSSVTKKIENTKAKKFAKDDMDFSKIRKEKIRKDMKKIVPKYSKDDFDLLLAMDQLRNMDMSKFEDSKFFQSVKNLKDTDMRDLSIGKINDVVEKLKIAFELSKNNLIIPNSIIVLINTVIGTLENINFDNKDYYANNTKKLNNILDQLKEIC